MPVGKFQIRVCTVCGLRYPQAETEPDNLRCPYCLGETRKVLEKTLTQEVDKPPRFKGRSEINLVVMLDNVRSISNVGSIFRSSEGLGLKHIYLCGITPTPKQAEVRKTALGAEQYISWSYHKDAVEEIKSLQARKYQILALETVANSMPVNQLNESLLNGLRETVVVVGNEVTGIDPIILEIADQRIHIPMAGIKSSLNVAVAFAILAYTLVLRRY